MLPACALYTLCIVSCQLHSRTVAHTAACNFPKNAADVPLAGMLLVCLSASMLLVCRSGARLLLACRTSRLRQTSQSPLPKAL
jgi:hypothetical protein